MIINAETDLSGLHPGDRLEVEAFLRFLDRRGAGVTTPVDLAYANNRLPAIHYLRELDPT